MMGCTLTLSLDTNVISTPNSSYGSANIYAVTSINAQRASVEACKHGSSKHGSMEIASMEVANIYAENSCDTRVPPTKQRS